jgi:hypothetical protein
MTKDDTIRMAREAGMAGMLTDVVTTFDELERFAALVREECAKIVENYTGAWDDEGYALASAIRAGKLK